MFATTSSIVTHRSDAKGGPQKLFEEKTAELKISASMNPLQNSKVGPFDISLITQELSDEIIAYRFLSHFQQFSYNLQLITRLLQEDDHTKRAILQVYERNVASIS